METTHPVSRYCQGVACRCGAPATHKLGEEIFDDDPLPIRHNLTAYVCCAHFVEVVGPAAPCGQPYVAPPPWTAGAFVQISGGAYAGQDGIALGVAAVRDGVPVHMVGIAHGADAGHVKFVSQDWLTQPGGTDE